MALPGYNKENRRKVFEQLPKGAYVLKILNAKEEPNKSGNGSHLTISFDIAEGEYADFYRKQYDANTKEDKRWPVDATYYLGVPTDNSQEFVKNNWDTFFADLEDSNGGKAFNMDPAAMKGMLIGGKFAIEQTEYNGNIYDHTRLRWTCLASDVREGTAGKMPNDKMVSKSLPPAPDEWINVPEGIENDLPF